MIWEVTYLHEQSNKEYVVEFEGSADQMEAMKAFHGKYPNARIISMEPQVYS